MISDILQFWFGEPGSDAEVAARQTTLWFQKDASTDARLKERFEQYTLAAEAGELDDWRAEPEGLLALLLLTDQFPRNIYRDTPDAFRFDALARDYCLYALDTGMDRMLAPVQRVFCYLPLEHSEQPIHQERSVALFTELAQAVPEAQRAAFHGFVDYAEKHRVVIARFGRFPHRNAILGRPSTEEELLFLQQPGSSF